MNKENSIHFLIPISSKGKEKDWGGDIRNSALFEIFLISLFETNKRNKIDVFLHLGIDEGDKIYDIPDLKEKIISSPSGEFIKDVNIVKYKPHQVSPGHLTRMWNILLSSAVRKYPKDAYYFYQCGDDVQFIGDDCLSLLIKEFEKTFPDGVGLLGLDGDNDRILTQTFFSKAHYSIFGFLFPDMIMNWYCDDWINGIYKTANRFIRLKDEKHFAMNIIKNDKNRYANNISVSCRKTIANIIEKDSKKIMDYLK